MVSILSWMNLRAFFLGGSPANGQAGKESSKGHHREGKKYLEGRSA
jgi:hypothetical protein